MDAFAACSADVNGVRQKSHTLHWGNDQEMCGAVLTYSEVLK